MMMDADNHSAVDMTESPNATQAHTSISWKKKIILWAAILGGFLVVCWSIVLYDALAEKKNSLAYHGIIPRTTKGLVGIISSPFLHTGFEHVAVDSLGVLILGGFLMLSSLRAFFSVTVFVWVLAGFLTWCVGRADVSIVGTGTVCFGWFGYLILTPFFARPISVKAIGLAAITGLLYGGIIFSVFPTDAQVVWEAGLCGLISGLVCSFGYWYFYLRWLLPKHLSKHLPGKSLTGSTTTHTNADATKSHAIILPQPQIQTQHSKAYAPQASLLAESHHDNSSPFGNQETVNRAPPPATNSFEPAWLYDTPGSTAPAYPTTNAPSSSNPSWLDPTPSPSLPPPNQTYKAPETFNPFG